MEYNEYGTDQLNDTPLLANRSTYCQIMK